MQLLYSSIFPLAVKENQKTFIEFFKEKLLQADTLEIAVGYVSKAALKELASMVEEFKISKVTLVIGMYYIEGMPEGTYHAAMEINNKWRTQGIGEIRLVRSFKYHGKIYVFRKGDDLLAGIVGSNNLGSLKLEASNLRQYEISMATDISNEVKDIEFHLQELSMPKCSLNIADISNISLIREINHALVDQQYVEKVTPDETDAYKSKLINVSFEIPLKVPADENDPNMRGSNINVCYAKGRKRVWWENEIVVSKDIRELPGYPEYQKPFMAVTDDGWKFKAWTCGDNNKNLYSKDDLKIMGRWIKGRLVSAGLVDAVNTVEKDTEYKGVITRKMLNAYGRDTITLTKTSLTTKLENGTVLDVWMLSFLPEKKEGMEAEL